jgi:hypothetical protein
MHEQVGNIEIGENGGIAQKYLKSVGLKGNYPYCAAGQYFCFAEACIKIEMNESNIPISKTGLSRAILSDAKRVGVKIKAIPEKHDLIIWRVRNHNWKGHIERVISNAKSGWIITIGFNVSLGNGKEGVAIKKRNIYHPLGKMLVAGIVGFKGI